MNRHTDPIMSREYKLMLDVSKFSQTFEATANDFIRHFAEEIEQAGILDSPLELEEAPLKINDDKSVEVRFFDTADIGLRKSNYVFRERSERWGIV